MTDSVFSLMVEHKSLAINNKNMDLQVTHIAGKIEAVGSLKRTRSAEDSINYTHITFSLLHDGSLKVMEAVAVGYLLNSYITLGMEGDFYFLEFCEQTYWVGLKNQFWHVIDSEFSKVVLPISTEEKTVQLLYKQNNLNYTILRFITVVKCGLVVFLLFPPSIIVVTPIWFLIGIYYDKILERIIKNFEKLRQIFDEIERSNERSKNLFLQEMKRIME